MSFKFRPPPPSAPFYTYTIYIPILNFLFFKIYFLIGPCSKGGFQYGFGYIQRKEQNKFPDLEMTTKPAMVGSRCPNNSLVSHCSKVEERFQNFNGATDDMDPMLV